MIAYYTHSGGREGFQKSSARPKQPAWINGDNVGASELQHIAAMYGFDGNILRDVLDRDELPRVEVKSDAIYVFVRFAERAKNGRVQTAPILMAVRNHCFLSLTNLSYDSRLEQAVAGAELRQPIDMLLVSLATIIGDYEAMIQHTAHRIHDVKNRLRTHEVNNDDFINFVTIEDNLNEYQANLTGAKGVVERLSATFPADREPIEDINLYIRQLLNTIISHKNTVTSIRNAYSTIANNTLNHRMKTLTLLTLLIALPNVFYGMYGMNVALPFQEAPWAYAMVVGFTAVLVVGTYFLARKLKIL